MIRNETDARVTLYKATAVGTVATQITPINHEGVPNASLYVANFCTANVHYAVKGCYNKSETSTSYWYSIVTGTADVNEVVFLGAHDISGLADCHGAMTVEYYASGVTTGTFVLQLMCW